MTNDTIANLLKTKKALVIQGYPSHQMLSTITNRIHDVANTGKNILIINTNQDSVFATTIAGHLNIIHQYTIIKLIEKLKNNHDSWLKKLGLIIVESGTDIFHDVNQWELAFYLLQDRFLRLQLKDFPSLCVLIEPRRATEPAIKEALPLFDTLELKHNETNAWGETSVHVPKENIKTQWWTIWSSKESQEYLNKIRPNNTGRNVGIIAPLSQFAGQRGIDKKNNLAFMDRKSGELDRLENYAENELFILYRLEEELSWQTLHQFDNFSGCITTYCESGNSWATLHKISHGFQGNILCNVIANNVLLLDYLLYNAACFAEVPLQPLAPRIKRNSAYNTIFMLLQRLKYLKQLSLYTIRSAITAIDDIDGYDTHLDGYDTFINLVKKYFGKATSDQLSLKSSYEWNDKNQKYEVEYDVCFLNEHLNINVDWLEPVSVIDGNTVFEQISKEHVYQNFWVGKLVLYFGKVFQVTKINIEDNIINISHCGNKLLMDYRVQKEINIDNPINNKNKIDSLSSQILYGDNHFHIETFTLSYRITSKNIVANDSKWARESFVFKDVEFSERVYKFGRAIRISLFDSDGKPLFTDNTALAFSAWLNEASITLFPESHEYFISAPQMLDKNNRPNSVITNYCIPELIYAEHLDKYPCVWIFEDSQTDMGLVHSIYDNHAYLLDICYDWLEWYFVDLPATQNQAQVCLQNEKYTATHWFGFGSNTTDKNIDLVGLKNLLESVFSNRGIFNLTTRRKNVKIEIPTNKYLDDKNKDAHHVDCDICGVNIAPETPSVSLSDGRISCQSCHDTAVTSIDDLRSIYENILVDFFAEKFAVNFAYFDIALVDQKVISAKQNKDFIPTSSFDTRAIGLAVLHYADSATSQDSEQQYTVMIESGHNLESSASTLAHELCHIWQYQNLDHDRLEKDYGKYLIEGQAVWTEEAFLNYVVEKGFDCFDMEKIKHQQKAIEARKLADDEYGKGYRLLKSKLASDLSSQHSAYKWLKKHYKKQI